MARAGEGGHRSRMAEADERRRLRLVRARPEVAPFAQRVRAPGRAIGIADAVPAEAALVWSIELAVELARSGPCTLVACAFGEAPALAAELVARAMAAGVVVEAHAVEPDARGFEAIFAARGEATRDVWVCVGEPALALLDPWLGVLLAGDAPASRWLASLRPHAEAASLVLGLPRPGLARALAALIA
jgi:hypothetical protein